MTASPGGEAPADHPARLAIAEELATTVFVDAGAGSGKTKSLVDRIVNLLVSGVSVERLAAITFTEAAAAELRDRIAEHLESVASGPGPDGGVGDAARASAARRALDDLDGAVITTLHGFARRLLAEYPIDAGLPLRIDVLDDAASRVARSERNDLMVRRLLDRPELAVPMRVLGACGVGVGRLLELADALDDNWDLLEDHPPPAPAHPSEWAPDLAGLGRAVDAALAARDGCSDPADRLRAALDALGAAWPDVDASLRAARDPVGVLGALGRLPVPAAGGRGRTANWRAIDEAREALTRVRDEVEGCVDALTRSALEHVVSEVAAVVLGSAEQRRSAGTLSFHDLLVLCRRMLRGSERVRRQLHERFAHILVDEFQDTDPIQGELVMRIAADPGIPGAGPGAADWRSLETEPGRVFFVGDPKQSIYRFRRADVTQFLERKAWSERVETLSTNFRSVPGIIEWVNATFSSYFSALAAEHGEGAIGFESLVPARPALGEPPGEGPGALAPVVVLGGRLEEDGTPASEIHRMQADAVATHIAALRGRLPVRGGAGEAQRTARYADVAILVPTRTSVPALEAALDAHAIPFRLDSSSLAFSAREVEELLAVLRAVAQPDDPLAVVAALRTPGFAVGDDDLVRHAESDGRWSPGDPPPGDGGERTVVEALVRLGRLVEAAGHLALGRLVDLVVDECCLREQVLDRPRHRDAWRRIQYLADAARSYEEQEVGRLTGFLAWVEVQQGEGVRSREVVLPESDDDAVRIMTIHASKGLQFPVVVLAGLGTELRNGSGPVLWGPGGPEVSLKKGGWSGGLYDPVVRTPGWEDASRADGAAEAQERARLLYVAATRAEDHLAVGLLHGPKGRASHARLLHPHAAEAPDAAVLYTAAPAAGRVPEAAPADAAGADAALADRDAWVAHRAAAEAMWVRREVVSATGVQRMAAAAQLAAGRGAEGVAAPGGVEDPFSVPHEEPWRRGRAGTDLGKAVHAVLQVVDLATGEGLPELARAAARDEGVPGQEGVVERLVRAALGSEVVRGACGSGRYWRELYVGTVVGEHTVEGFVDLLVELPSGGLRVVDYKTDRTDTEADAEAIAARYRYQGATYALAVEAVSGRTVEDCIFLVLREAGALAVPVPDLAGALDDVRSLLGAAPAG